MKKLNIETIGILAGAAAVAYLLYTWRKNSQGNGYVNVQYQPSWSDTTMQPKEGLIWA